MRIDGWECVVSADGLQRGASHPEDGSIAYVGGQIIGFCGDCPAMVVQWLIRPALSYAWERGQRHDGWHNPYDSEPPNHDKDPS